MRLGDIASVKAGNVAPKKGLFSERGIPFVRAGSLSRLLDGESPRSLERIDKMTADKLGMQLFPEGTILFAKSGMSCMTGNVYVLKEPCYVVSHLACVAIDNTELTLYLKHYFRWNKPNALVENPSFPSIRLGKIKDMEIRLPDARQIARWVSTLERIEGLMETHEHQLSLLDDLVKSRFVEMFGDPTNGVAWPSKRLDEICTIVTGNTPPRKDPSNYGDYIEWCKTDNITDAKYLTTASEMLSEEGALRGRVVPAGSILMACIAGSVKSIGKVAVADRSVAFNQQINALIPSEMIDVEYLLWALRLSKDYLCSGVNMQLKGILNKTSLSAKSFCVPPLALQQQFAAFVAEVDKSRFVVQKQIEKLQALYDSLAQEYFG